jgi:hypothetical protein
MRARVSHCPSRSLVHMHAVRTVRCGRPGDAFEKSLDIDDVGQLRKAVLAQGRTILEQVSTMRSLKLWVCVLIEFVGGTM